MFPRTLHFVLSNADTQHIISWLPNGMAWKIHDPQLFVDSVMTKYFGVHTDVESFERRLNGWGFKRICQGIGQGAYYHERFHRDSTKEELRLMTFQENRIDPSKIQEQNRNDVLSNAIPYWMPNRATISLPSIEETEAFRGRFPYMLFLALSDPMNHAVISWLPHGRSWQIHNQYAFQTHIMPRYFGGQTKYPSFLRQVSGWKFKRYAGTYFHKLFLRDYPHLMYGMKREKHNDIASPEEQFKKKPLKHQNFKSNTMGSWTITYPDSKQSSESTSHTSQSNHAHVPPIYYSHRPFIEQQGQQVQQPFHLHNQQSYVPQMYPPARPMIEQQERLLSQQVGTCPPRYHLARPMTEQPDQQTQPYLWHVHQTHVPQKYHLARSMIEQPEQQTQPYLSNVQQTHVPQKYHLARSMIEREQQPQWERRWDQVDGFIADRIVSNYDVSQSGHTEIVTSSELYRDATPNIRTISFPAITQSPNDDVTSESERYNSNYDPIDDEFYHQLRIVLSTPEYHRIISWMPHDNAWKIHNQELFVETVMPKYFPDFTTFDSFIRQVRGLGFKLVKQGSSIKQEEGSSIEKE